MNNAANNYGYIGGYQANGYNFNPNPNPPKMTQTLTKEQIDSLRRNVDKFSLGLTQEEVLRGICFHRNADQSSALKQNPDGTVTCTICGYTFDPDQNQTEEDLHDSVDNIIDILQTIKVLYLDMPENTAKEYFQIIPLIEKIPELFKIASENFSRHDNWNAYRFNGGPNVINLYNMLQGGIDPYMMNQAYGQPMGGGMPMGQPMMNQPMGQPMGMPMGQPMMNQPMGQPMGQPMMGMPTAPGSNGFSYVGQPQQPYNGYQPMNNGYQYNPNVMNQGQAQQPAGTVQPTSTTATTDGKEVKVDTTFNA